MNAKGDREMRLTVSLEDWRQACGIQSERPELIRRALTPAHEELKAINYLTDVHVIGRGRKQEIEYVFAEVDAPDPALVELLIGVGLSRASASDLAAEYGDRVETAVAFVRHRQTSARVKNPAGLVVDVLKNEEKYVLPESIMQRSPESDPGQEAQERIRVEEQNAVAEAEAYRQAIHALPPDRQFEELAPALRLVFKSLGRDLLKVLEQRCRSGQLSAAHLSEQAAKAREEIRMPEFSDEMKEKLQS